TGYPGDIAGRIMKGLAESGKAEKEERNVETYAVKMCWKNTVFTCDPEIVKDILTNDFSNYIKGTSMTDALRSVLGSGVFNTNGDLWRFHRSMSRPFFTRDRLRDIIPVFVRHADRALDLVTKRNGKSGNGGMEGLATIDVQDLASRLTLDATTEFLFGSCVNSLEEELPRPWNDTEAPLPSSCTTSPSSLSVEKDTTSPSSTLGSCKLSKGLEKSSPPTPKRSNSQESILPIASSPATSQADPKTPAFPSAFTSALQTLASHHQLIQDELINILIAGRDTTASCMTFATYLLSQHPAVLRRLSEEVSNVLETSPSSSPIDEHPATTTPHPSTRTPSLDDLRKMPFLRAVINETLRLFPSVPLN
ncbi:10988_t:CDS:2, partial [Acaulospora colombiana]